MSEETLKKLEELSKNLSKKDTKISFKDLLDCIEEIKKDCK